MEGHGVSEWPIELDVRGRLAVRLATAASHVLSQNHGSLARNLRACLWKPSFTVPGRDGLGAHLMEKTAEAWRESYRGGTRAFLAPARCASLALGCMA